VHVLHSMVEREEQDAALALDPGRCKVVLSTNIAESSVTLPAGAYTCPLLTSNCVVFFAAETRKTTHRIPQNILTLKSKSGRVLAHTYQGFTSL